MLGVIGEVREFVGVARQVVEFEARTLEIVFSATFAVVGAIGFENFLPGWRGVEVAGEGVGELVGDVEDEFVVAVVVGAHRIVVGDFVEGVRRENRVEAFGTFFADRFHEAAALEGNRSRRAFFGLAVVVGWSDLHVGFGGDAAPIENGGSEIGPTDEGVASTATLFGARIANDEREIHAGFVGRCFGAGEGGAVVGEKHDKRVFGVAGVFECVEQISHALVESVDRLIVRGEFIADGGGIRKPGGNLHGARFEGDEFDAGVVVGVFVEVREAVPSTAMRIGRAPVEEEGLFVVLGDPLFRVSGHANAVAAALDAFVAVFVEVVDELRGDVVFTDRAGAIARVGEHHGERRNAFVGAEVVVAVGVAVVAGRVVVETGEDDASAGAATRGRAVSAGEARSLSREAVNVGSFGDGVAVTAGLEAHVVGDDNDDVAGLGVGGRGQEREGGNRERSESSHVRSRKAVRNCFGVRLIAGSRGANSIGIDVREFDAAGWLGWVRNR